MMLRYSFDLDDDGSFNQAIQESHGQRPIGEILRPSIKIHIGNQCGRTLLVTRGDDLVQQVGRLGTLQPFNGIR